MHGEETVSWAELDAILDGVERPARYTGGELNSVSKHEAQVRLALCFPDLYEIGESYLGFKILYDVVNRAPELAAERVYAVAPDLERRLRERRVPLGSLETRRPLRCFDVAGFTLQYELSYPTLLAMLELGGIPLRAVERDARAPFVVGGGPGSFNPEPLAPFFDAFLLGDGEEAVLEILRAVARSRARGDTREATLVELAGIRGVYVPAHFQLDYDGLALRSVRHPLPLRDVSSRHGTPRVARRVLADIERVAYPTRQVQPHVQPIHDRLAIEIQRGCSRGCRFCQAGMVQRPTRQRRPEAVVAIAEAALRDSAADTLGLLSLSAGDYGPLERVLSALLSRCEQARVALSLPSLRTETLSAQVAACVNRVSSGGFTLAPEAGSDRLRRVINKNNSDADLLKAVGAAATAGARNVKLYFMLGLPTETEADVDAIAGLSERARVTGRAVRRDFKVTVSVSTFVPKPHTPFQWERQLSVAETLARQERLRAQLRRTKITMRYHDAEQSFVEGVLARGDRRLAAALEAAMRSGCRLDAWSDHFVADKWRRVLTEALAPHGLMPDDYLAARDEARLLPWDHLDAGVLKKFLRVERKRAYNGREVADCALSDRCYACGGCDRADPYVDRRAPEGHERPALLPVMARGEPRPPAAVAAASLGSEGGSTVAALVGKDPRVFAIEPQGVALPHAVSAQGPALAAGEHLRLRFRYEKLGPAAYLSPLEAGSELCRAIRRVALPVVYSEGHTPRLRVSFSPACPTGIESVAEYFDALCSTPVDVAPLAAVLNAQLPVGLRVISIEPVGRKAPSLNASIVTMRYTVRLPGLSERELADAIRDFCCRKECLLTVSRKGLRRSYDTRALVRELTLEPHGVSLDLTFSPAGALKAREAVAAIFGEGPAHSARICKRQVIFSATVDAARKQADGAVARVTHAADGASGVRAAGLESGSLLE